MTSVRLRQWHFYLGMFISPSVLFFALTGSLQLFGLHEAHGDYVPYTIVERLGTLHKDQVATPKKPHAEPAPAEGEHAAGEHADSDHDQDHDHDEDGALSTTVLKWFFLFVAISLCTSTVLGLWIGLLHSPRRRAGIGLFAAGALVPILMVILQLTAHM